MEEETNTQNKSKLLIIIAISIVAIGVLVLIVFKIIIPSFKIEKQKVFKNDAIIFSEAAQKAYDDLINQTNSNFSNEISMCIDINYLNAFGYYTKGPSDGYKGSVLAAYNRSNRTLKYIYWLTDSKYMLLELTAAETDLTKITPYNSQKVVNIDSCPISAATFAKNSNEYVVCDASGCHKQIKPSRTPYCTKGEDNKSGCAITSTKYCDSGYDLVGSECVKRENPVYRCQDGYSMEESTCYKYEDAKHICPAGYNWDGTDCSKEIESNTGLCKGKVIRDGKCKFSEDSTLYCENGSLKNNKCYITAPAQYTCMSGTLTGSTCISRYQICSGEYDSINNICTETLEYAYNYSCPVGYTYKDNKCISNE